MADKGILIATGTKKIIFVFRPIYNVTSPTVITWLIHYLLDWAIDGSAYDMAKIRYKIYDNVSLDWKPLVTEGHAFLNNHNSVGALFPQYIGHQCNQVYYVSLTYNSKYLDTGGLVRVAICFDPNVSTLESELQEVGSDSKTKKRSEMSVFFNSMEIY